MIRVSGPGADRLPVSLLLSVAAHLLLLSVFLTFWHRPLVLVNRVVEVEFADISDIRNAEKMGQESRARPSSGLDKVKLLLEQTRNIIPFLNQEKQPDRSGPSVAKPAGSREDLARENREKLEKELSESGEPVRPQEGKRKSPDRNLLSTEDSNLANDVKSGSSGAPANGDRTSPDRSGGGGVNSRLVLSDQGRKVLYEPPPPVYPEWAKRDRIQGRIVLKVWFDKDGFPVAADVVESSGNALLDATAKNHALKFRIDSIREDREDSGTFTINFVL